MYHPIQMKPADSENRNGKFLLNSQKTRQKKKQEKLVVEIESYTHTMR